jgi:hypothetical protein
MTDENDPARVLACPFCGGTMRIATIASGPRESARRRAFECAGCSKVMTLEDED